MARKGQSKEALRKRQAKSAALQKRYRHEASELKKLGVLSEKVNARKNISKSTRTKINKFRDVLEGKVSAVKAPKQARAAFHDVLEERGSFLLVPKDRKTEVARFVKRGETPTVEIARQLVGPKGVAFGEEREVILPFRLVDMPQLVERLQTDESLDGLKKGNEYFAFKIDGWASKYSFANAKEMGDYISQNYAHLFKPGMAKKVVKYLTFVRFIGERASEGHHQGLAMKRPPHKPSAWKTKQRLQRDAQRKKLLREKEAPEAREKRLAEQRARSARNRQRKFLGD